MCSTGIQGSNYSHFRACSKPGLFQKNLIEHADFILLMARECVASCTYLITCHNCSFKENPASNNNEFLCLVESLQTSLPAFPHGNNKESELIEIAAKYTVEHVALKLLDNQALTLLTDTVSLWIS